MLKHIRVSYRFPRARGDVPLRVGGFAYAHGFSPRTRGCSGCQVEMIENPRVFPAHAGMFLRPSATHRDTRRFPRARGDVPVETTRDGKKHLFSPRTRGCSAYSVCAMSSCRVFPAHAGMFRSRAAAQRTIRRFPRARGDVPRVFEGVVGGHGFSPRTRGCS